MCIDITVILITFLIVTAISFLFAYRNEWVYARRVEALDKGLKEYDKLLSYDEMLNLWWIWEIEKLKKPNKTR